MAGSKDKKKMKGGQEEDSSAITICSPENVCVKVSDQGDEKKERIKVRYSGTGKRCPFFFAGDDFVAHCIGTFCMFWNEGEQDCNINVIAQSLAK